MHPVISIKHWSHHIGEHLHSRHFWAGVGITVLIVGLFTLLFIAVKNTPVEWQGPYPYGNPYIP